MAIPSTIKAVKPQDFTLQPVNVYNPYTLKGSDLENTSSGYLLVHGHYSSIIPHPNESNFDSGEVNLSDGSYTRTIWKQIDHQYYRDTFEKNSNVVRHNPNTTFRFLNYTASLLSCPYADYGLRIKPKSVIITNFDIEYQPIFAGSWGDNFPTIIRDDGYGNLYIQEINDQIKSFQRNSKIGYWGFNELFRLNRFNTGKVNEYRYKFDSSMIPSEDYKSYIKNVDVVDGVKLFTYFESNVDDMPIGGMAIKFNNESYVMTPHHRYMNFSDDSEFSISFAVRHNQNNLQFDTGSLISKRGVILKDQYGELEFTKGQSGQTWNKLHVSSSYVDESTNVYPFDFRIVNSDIIFSRSDGSNKVTLSGSIEIPGDTTYDWNSITVTRYFIKGKPYISLFINGDDPITVHDTTKNPINNNALMFGAENMKHKHQFTDGVIDEIKIFNETVYDGNNLDVGFFKLYNQNLSSFLNTSVVGNVFYERGDIVISPLNSTFKDALKGNFEVTYEGTHTIYHYEVLCRIPKGSFNLSVNPTARVTSESDELRKEFAGWTRKGRLSEFVDAAIGDPELESELFEYTKVQSDYLRPYASSIGLYNDNGELVAVAKFGQPIQMRDDVDLNILIKFDG